MNGAAVVDPDEESIETLKSAIANARGLWLSRLLKARTATFVRGAGGAAGRYVTPPEGASRHEEARRHLLGPEGRAARHRRPRRAVPRPHLRGRRYPERRQGGAVVRRGRGVGRGDGRRRRARGKGFGGETDASLVGIEDARGRLLGYADQGRSSVLDANRSTILEIDSAGECRGHHGLHVGSLVGFTYHHTKLVAFVFLLLTHLFRDKPKSFLRAMRKSASRASGAHGFFAKAA